MENRLAKFNELVPSTLPFVEGKLEGHKERKNYSILGPGVAEDANQSRLRKFLVDAKKELSQKDLEVYGPFDSPVTKIGYKHRMFCIIQSSKKQRMLEVLSEFAKNTEESKKSISAWVIDIDPINAV